MVPTREARNEVLEVLNPVASIAPARHTLSARLGDLRNKKIGLLWNLKPGGDHLASGLAESLGKQFAGMQFEIFKYDYPVKPANLQKVIKSGCDAIVGLTGD